MVGLLVSTTQLEVHAKLLATVTATTLNPWQSPGQVMWWCCSLQGHGRLWSWDPAPSGETWESSRFLALAGAKGDYWPSFHGDIVDILHFWSLELVLARVSCTLLGCQLVPSFYCVWVRKSFRNLASNFEGYQPFLWESFLYPFGRKLARKVQFEKNMLSDWKVLDEQVSLLIEIVLRCPSCLSLDLVCWTKRVFSRRDAGLKCTNLIVFQRKLERTTGYQ